MGTDQQQFCLRWHSYQSSLMATLPQLLDGNYLTDVTLSAQGRNLQAHKVILSACSHYFKELFKELQPLQHPVIVLPGMNFSDLVALVTFMYSGEVNIYQHQLSGLLTMADVLHIRGLSEVGSEAGNAGMDSLAPPVGSAKREQKSPTTGNKRAKLSMSSSPTHITSPSLDRERDPDKRCKESALDYALYGKRSWSQALDPNLYTNGSLPQEVAENLATLDSNLNASQYQAFSGVTEKMVNMFNPKVVASRKKLVDRSRNYVDDSKSSGSSGVHVPDVYLRVKTEQELVGGSDTNPQLMSGGKLALEKDGDERKGTELSPPRIFSDNLGTEDKTDSTPSQGLDLSQGIGGSNSITTTSTTNNSPSSKCVNTTAGSGSTPTAHTKLYATCFVCGKQLSNQYNLRVHMETHQNVQYACSICSHVSRSKDALRKHVSYRHPTPPDANGSSSASSSSAAKREGRKKADQSANVSTSSTSTSATSALSTTACIVTAGNNNAATSSVSTIATSTVTSSESL